MPSPQMNPFTETDCDCWNRILERGGAIKELLDCLADCTIPLDQLKQENGQYMDMAAKLKAKFFPDRA